MHNKCIEKEHSIDFRVYYEDTDAGKVVYHARYLHFFERARTEFIRGLGIDQGKLAADRDIAFVVRKMDTDFLAAAVLDDILTIKTKVKAIKSTTIEFEQQIFVGAKLLINAYVKVASISLSKFKAQAMPQDIKNKILPKS